MNAYHGSEAIKAKYLARVKAHAKADELIHGRYWENGKGCAVGCTIHGWDHARYETELGIPQVLARLEDGIFESLSGERAKLWPEQFLSAIRVGADLSLVWPKFAVWMLVDSEWGVLYFAEKVETKKVIQDVADAYLGIVEGRKETVDWAKGVVFRNAREQMRAAYAAADEAGEDAGEDADAIAVNAAAAAYDVTVLAPYPAAAIYAASAATGFAANAAGDARTEWILAQALKLLDLLSEA